jgi:diketogulonate reductase-like aldo/keto reductase
VETALEAGYRHFDTATLYKNEDALGRVFKRWIEMGRIRRDELFIVTKVIYFFIHNSFARQPQAETSTFLRFE